MNTSVVIHCASLGEYEQGKALIKLICKKNPEKKIVLTFFSPSGYEQEKNNPFADYVFYLPADVPEKMQEFVEKLNPEVFIFIKYEYWKNLIDILYRKKVKTYTVFAVFKPSDVYFKPLLRNFYKNLFAKLTKILVQEASSEQVYLEKTELKNVKIVVDGRIDTVFENLKEQKEFPEIEDFSRQGFCLVAGSTWKEDEKVLREVSEKFPGLRLLLVPHELTEKHLQFIGELFPEASFWSRKNFAPTTRILVIDTIGMLKYLYRYGNLCYVGGGFGAGIHNTLEAAIYGKPLAFGPNYKKFNEAVNFVEKGVAKSVENASELSEWIRFLQTEKGQEVSRKALSYLQENQGASLRAYEEIFGK